MYSIVREYLVESEKSEEFADRLRSEFLPEIESIPGFVAYYLVCIDPNRCMTINIFSDKNGAEASVEAARNWVASKSELTEMLPWPPRVVAGEVSLSSHSDSMVLPMAAVA
jgi:hypothetical protein